MPLACNLRAHPRLRTKREKFVRSERAGWKDVKEKIETNIQPNVLALVPRSRHRNDRIIATEKKLRNLQRCRLLFGFGPLTPFRANSCRSIGS
jgi:hypothetical protein